MSERLEQIRKEQSAVYVEHGYANRTEYLDGLAQQYDPDAVYALADLLGPEEDFDGLVTQLEDYYND